MNWIQAISELSRRDKIFVVVTVLSVEGSAPRNAATKMVVDEQQIYDTIGGGNLEFRAIDKARTMLATSPGSRTNKILRETFTLGKDLVQCCGGKVELLFERIEAKNFNIVIFGAGHVGKALISILAELPCQIKWIDSRPEYLEIEANKTLNANIEVVIMDTPESAVEDCPTDAYFLVMTHSHEMDMQLVEAILSRNDFQYCGLIGSKSKAAKFKNRLSRKQFSDYEIKRLTCPIGLEQIPGKRPMEVAVSVAGQLIRLHDLNSDNTQVARDQRKMKVVELSKK